MKQVKKNQPDSVAIVGIAFRFPGDLCDESSLWDALRQKRDLVTRVPSDRWSVDVLEHPNRSEPGRSITFSAGALSRIDDFDASFFGISPREAAWLDPQQRLLLELAWEAMENGGQVPSSLRGSDCAVYIGISSLDYGTRGLDDLAGMSPHSMTGNTLSIAANRLSYVFDLRGPSLAVDSACSSSLVALHHACNALRSREASMALVGGVSLLLHPYPFVGFTKASMLSADGRCKPFDASGNGYVRAEGGAVLLLKPLEKALADGDDIHAVILASGANADGARKTGITIPSRDGQTELMKSVLAQTGLSAHDVDFIEAHGTGTAVGDPIEAAAIGAVYGQGRKTPLPIGSIKGNLGHMEAASGMAGLVKAILVLKQRALPPTLHFVTPNPNIDFSGLNLEVVTQYRKLTRSDRRPLVVGVNSFGFGGANAHVLLQEYRSKRKTRPVTQNLSVPPLFLSARGSSPLRELAGRYASFLKEKAANDFYDVAYGAAFRRERLETRLAVWADDIKQSAELLIRYAQGESPASVVVEDALPEPGSIAFVYSGNGAQWLGMGRRLLRDSSRIAHLIAELDAAMQPVAGFSILAELNADEGSSRLDDTTVAQPLLFALQVALTVWLREQGIEPRAVTGHSVGEVAAAWAAGALDLDQAIQVIVARSHAQGLTRGMGRMAAVGLSEATMKEVLAELEVEAEIAGINSPGNITVSGDFEALEQLRRHLEPKSVFFRLLDLDYAFHSAKMDPIEGRLAESLAGLAPKSVGGAAFVSTVTGDEFDGTALTSEYWWCNVRQPVRFAQATQKLISLGCRVFIEIGPHAILQRYLSETLGAAGVKGRVLPTLRRNDDGLDRLREAVLRAHLLAEPANLEVFFPHPGRIVRLPNYPWQKERHWHPHTSEGYALIERRRVHPLLGWRLKETEAAWENTIDPATLPWLADHKVGGTIILPGAAFAEMALAAAREWLGGERYALEELDILAPVVFDGEHARTLRLEINPRDGGFQIKSRQRLTDDAWMVNAVGRILQAAAQVGPPPIEPVAENALMFDAATHYRLASALGLDYGPAFQGLGSVRVDGERLEASVSLPAAVGEGNYFLHPALLDVAFQTLVDFYRTEIEQGAGVALLPVKFGRLDYLRAGTVTTLRARLTKRSARSVLADFVLEDTRGETVATLTACRFRAAPIAQPTRRQSALWRIEPWLVPHPFDQRSIELPPSKALIQTLHEIFDEQVFFARRKTYFHEVQPLCEALTTAFAFEAFQGLFAEHGDWLQQALNLPEGVHETVRPLFHWLAGLLQRENLLVQEAGGWRLSASDLPPAQEIWQDLLRDHPENLPELLLLGRVGRYLPELLLGRLDAKAMRENLHHSHPAESLYDDAPAYLGTRLAIETLLDRLCQSFPDNRRLRILEVIDGASELPRSLAGKRVQDRLDYVLAHSDDALLAQSQAEYRDFPWITVVGLAPDAFTLVCDAPLPETFDVIILRHWASGTANPHAAVAALRKRLAGGGLLLLAERHPDASAILIRGLDPRGWYTGADGEPYSRLLPPMTWQRLLSEQAFDDIEIFTDPAAEGLAEGGYLVLAKRPVEAAAQTETPAAHWLILADGASLPLARRLAQHLESLGQATAVARNGVEADLATAQGAASLFAAMGDKLGAIDHVVALLGWPDPEDSAENAPEAPLAGLLHLVQVLARSPHTQPKLWLLTSGG
ncbi:MAG: type I polyketide synthase, partial [Bryobacteraceae bacterium]